MTERPKQYIVLVDQIGLACMGKLMPGLQFIEVEGMEIPDNKGYQLIATPLKSEVNQEAI